jgi:hypothetical protein
MIGAIREGRHEILDVTVRTVQQKGKRLLRAILIPD